MACQLKTRDDVEKLLLEIYNDLRRSDHPKIEQDTDLSDLPYWWDQEKRKSVYQPARNAIRAKNCDQDRIFPDQFKGGTPKSAIDNVCEALSI